MSGHDCDKIQNSSLGKDLTADDCAILSKIVSFRTLKEGEILFSAGESTHELYVLITGKVDVTKDTSPDEWITLHTLRAGDMAGEMSFIDGTSHSLTLRANGQSELLCLPREAFEALLTSNPHVVYHVMRAITRTMHQTLRRMNSQLIEMNRFINNEYTSMY